jgi:hypothetical protein
MDANTVIDLTWLQSATLDDLKAAMRNPSQLVAVNALLQTPEGKEIASDMLNDPDYKPRPKNVAPSAEEAAQIAADVELAERQAAEAAEAAAAEVAVVEPPAPVVEPSSPPLPVEEKKKIVIDYQVTAEDGTTPIGRRTHIEGWTNEEVIEKLKNAHINAVRYAERVKKNQVRSIEVQTQQNQAHQKLQQDEAEANAAVEAAAKEQDPVKLKDAISKVTKVEKSAEELKQEARRKGQEIADLWMADHKEDFQPCQANAKILSVWLKENNLGLTYENLELAFKATETQLAKPVAQAVAEETPAPAASNTPAAASATPAAVPPSIPAPVAAVAEPASTPAPPDSQLAPAAPASTSAAAANSAPAARRPGVNGGIAPGSLSAQRPPSQPQPSTTTRAVLLKEIKSMPPEKFRAKLKNAEYVKQLRAAGIPVASTVA